ncbi:MAG: hypothetical protein IT314_13655 [Anaerolineales bacterium]|nr:hypothetical protein [Anaerolineales bacterium]
MAVNSSLPKSVRSYFWDYPSAKLSLKTDRDLIIRRVLVSGSWDSIQWLRRHVSDGDLREWLITHRGRGLSPRQLRFWEVVLDLPSSRVNRWVQTARNSVWGKR